jgi:hypothetical protein
MKRLMDTRRIPQIAFWTCIFAAIALGAHRGLAPGGIALVSLLTHANNGGTEPTLATPTRAS